MHLLDNGESMLHVKDRELYIEALRQLEAADECIDSHALQTGLLCKVCSYSVVEKNLVIVYQLSTSFIKPPDPGDCLTSH